jgi:uncharacterized protein
MRLSQGLWKCSSFNNVFNVHGRHLLFSSLSGRLISFSEDQYQIIRENFDAIDRCGRPKDLELIDLLSRDSFIVPYDVDEREREHQKYLAEVSGEDNSILVIAPTMKCNFSCSYCFERHAVKSGKMDETTQEQLIELVRRRAEKCKRMEVQWTGGEPLLAFDVVEHLSQAFLAILEERGIRYEAMLLTNGSLLTPSMIAQFPRLKIIKLHLTFDGTIETFAERKGFSLSQSRAFHKRIFDLIPLVLDNVNDLTIRINIDRDNYKESYDVVRQLKQLSLMSPKINVELGLLEPKEGLIDSIPHSCLAAGEFPSFELQFKRFLASEGFRVYGFPEAKVYTCGAVKKYSYAIDSLGNVYRCLTQLGHKHCAYANLGDLDSLEMQSPESDYHISFDPWTMEPCKDCSLLPICAGDCPRRHEYEAPFQCTTKLKLAERLMFWEEYSRENPLGLG